MLGAGPANMTVIWKPVSMGHSSVMNKMALRPCRFKSATAAPPWLQLLLSQMTNTASPEEGHSAAADGWEKHSTPLALKWHSSAAFEQFAPSSYTVRRCIHQCACERTLSVHVRVYQW